MSIAGYLGRQSPERLKIGEQRAAEGEEFYKRVEDYDPVLRSHCGLNVPPGTPRAPAS